MSHPTVSVGDDGFIVLRVEGREVGLSPLGAQFLIGSLNDALMALAKHVTCQCGEENGRLVRDCD